MSVEFVDLVRAVRETPDDIGPRRVLADWFLERGDPRGEFIVAQCRLSERGLDPATRGHLKKRVAALFSKYGDRWLKPAHAVGARPFALRGQGRPATDNWDFRQGFLHSIRCPIDTFLEHWQGLLDVEPIVHLELTDASSESVERLACTDILAPHRSLVRRLTIRGEIGDDGVASLAEMPSLARLERLNLGSVGLSDRSLPRLLEVADFRPRMLAFSDNEITDRGAHVLAQAPALEKLECLYLSRTRIADDGVASLAMSRHLGRLERLTLGALEELTDQGAQALLDSSHLTSLRYLELDQCWELGYDMVEKLAERYQTVRR